VKQPNKGQRVLGCETENVRKPHAPPHHLSLGHLHGRMHTSTQRNGGIVPLPPGPLLRMNDTLHCASRSSSDSARLTDAGLQATGTAVVGRNDTIHRGLVDAASALCGGRCLGQRTDTDAASAEAHMAINLWHHSRRRRNAMAQSGSSCTILLARQNKQGSSLNYQVPLVTNNAITKPLPISASTGYYQCRYGIALWVLERARLSTTRYC
jgi:hypothetical protein